MGVEFPNRTPAPSAQEGPGFPVYNPAPTLPSNPNAQSNPFAEYESVIKEDKDKQEEREHLFTIGKVKVYAPRDEDISPNFGFKMIRDIRKFGPMIAAANMIGDLLGDEALDALADAPKDISRDDWDVILEVLGEKVFSKFKNLPGAGGKG